jgi:hypothetical protein
VPPSKQLAKVTQSDLQLTTSTKGFHQSQLCGLGPPEFHIHMGGCGDTCKDQTDQGLISPQLQTSHVAAVAVETEVLSGICMGKV